MRPLHLTDLPPLATFVEERPRRYEALQAVKAPRRVHVGPHLTLLFENRATVLWQVMEMCRVERITQPEAVQAELDAYNPLLPGPGELSATLLVEYPDEAERKRMLVALNGLDRHLHLVLEGLPPVAGVFEGGREQEGTGKISAVQFVRFPLGAEALAALKDFSRRASFRVDHPAYEAESILPGATRGALLEDLMG